MADYPASATFYVRLSLMNPKPGKEELVAGLVNNLLEYFSQQPGYVRGYSLIEGDPQHRVGRISVWESEEAADLAAQTQHVLTVRSEMMQLIDEDSHIERSYKALDPHFAQASNA